MYEWKNQISIIFFFRHSLSLLPIRLLQAGADWEWLWWVFWKTNLALAPHYWPELFILQCPFCRTTPIWFSLFAPALHAQCKEEGVFVQECAIFCLASTLFNLAFYGGEGLYLPSKHYPMIISSIVSNIISPCKNPSFALWHGLWGFCSVDWHHSLAPTQVYVRTLAKSFSSLWPLDLPYSVGDKIICSENTSRILGLISVFWLHTSSIGFIAMFCFVALL